MAASPDFLTNAKQHIKNGFKAFLDVLEVFPFVICVFDDIPFLLLESPGNLGPFLLVGAGFLVFPNSIFEGAKELYSAIKKKKGPLLTSLAIGQIFSGFVGLASTSVLLYFTLHAAPL